jgi:calcineurin-like phosphoesterase family protein
MDDDLYILGDLMLNNDNAGLRLIKSLKGRLHVILGNHDSTARQALYRDCYNIVDVKYADMINIGKKEFYLSHYPTCIGNFGEKHGPYCLCGHTHTQDKFSDIDKRCYHVELDAHDNKPVSIEEIIDDIKRRKEKCK